jgi:hypothetical protein
LIPPEAKASGRPPVHIQDLSGDEVSSIGNEESNGGSHVGWPPDAPPWHNCIPKLRRIPRDREVAGHLDDSGSNCIHADTLWSQLNRQFTCEGIDSSLRRSINWVSGKTTEAMLCIMNRNRSALMGEFQRDSLTDTHSSASHQSSPTL